MAVSYGAKNSRFRPRRRGRRVVERDPLQILKRSDEQIATDKVDGDVLSKFVEFLFQYLGKRAPQLSPKPLAGNKIQVYLSYQAPMKTMRRRSRTPCATAR